MRILRDNGWDGCGFGCEGGWSSPNNQFLKTIVVPSGTPPWNRIPAGATPAILANTGSTIDPTVPTTYLEATTPLNPVGNYLITHPNGSYYQQSITIAIPSNMLSTTQPWLLTGQIANATGILFNGLGWNAVLVWDSFNWNWVGGNATLQH